MSGPERHPARELGELELAFLRVQARKGAAGVPSTGEQMADLADHRGMLLGTDLDFGELERVALAVGKDVLNGLDAAAGAVTVEAFKGAVLNAVAGAWADGAVVGLELAAGRRARARQLPAGDEDLLEEAARTLRVAALPECLELADAVDRLRKALSDG